MRIALDASSAIKKVPGGIGTAILEMVRALQSIAPEDRLDLCVRASRLRRWQTGLLPMAGNTRLKLLFLEPLHLIYPRLIDVFHGPDGRLPRFRGCACVVTFHDMFNFISSDFAEDEFRQTKQQRCREACAVAQRIIVSSENTRCDLLKHVDVDPARVRVVPLGVSDVFHPQAEHRVAAVREKHGLRERYCLFVGQVQRRKNVARIIRAFDRVRRQCGFPLRLVIVGRFRYGSEEAVEALRAPGVSETVTVIEHAGIDDLIALYSGASVTLFPTLYEGFGLPVLESMACGAPVVTSNVSSLPEVAGDAALQVDPRDEEAIARAALALLTDPDLHGRMRRRGLERVRQFTWQRTARLTHEVYREAAGERTAPVAKTEAGLCPRNS